MLNSLPVLRLCKHQHRYNTACLLLSGTSNYYCLPVLPSITSLNASPNCCLLQVLTKNKLLRILLPAARLPVHDFVHLLEAEKEVVEGVGVEERMLGEEGCSRQPEDIDEVVVRRELTARSKTSQVLYNHSLCK